MTTVGMGPNGALSLEWQSTRNEESMSDQERCPTNAREPMDSINVCINHTIRRVEDRKDCYICFMDAKRKGSVAEQPQHKPGCNKALFNGPMGETCDCGREQAVEGLIRHLGQALRQWKSYAEDYDDVDLDSDSTTEAEMYRNAKSAYEAESRGERQ